MVHFQLIVKLYVRKTPNIYLINNEGNILPSISKYLTLCLKTSVLKEKNIFEAKYGTEFKNKKKTLGNPVTKEERRVSCVALC